jgi:hypothetical protein
MKYMLFTYRDPSVQLDPEQRAAVPAAVAAWCEEMDARGGRLEGHVLGPLTEARTLRIRAGEMMIGTGRSLSRPFRSPDSTSSNVPTSMRPSKLPPRTRGRTSESWS